MTDQQIRVVITGVASDLRAALDGAKGDLGGLKAAIKDVPNQVKIDVQAETVAATERLRLLRDAAKDVPDKIKVTADADTGVASAKLRLLQGQIRDTETSLAKVALGLGGSGSGGGSAGSGVLGVAGAGAGGLPGTGGALVAGSPVIAGAVGSGVAVAGSAGAGLLGAGAVGTAGLGALLAGIGPLAILSSGLKDAIALSGKLEIAQHNLTGAVAVFGAGSKQAVAAQDALNKTMAGADPAVLKFALSWGKVTDALDTASQSVLPAFTTALTPILDTFTKLLPTIEQMAKIDLRGISAGLKPLLDFANSSGFKTALLDLSRTFSQIAGPIGQAFTNLLRAMLNVAVAASPFLVRIADAFAQWTKSFSDALTPGKHLNDLIGGLVSQLQSWWNLATSLGGLMSTIFSAGAGTGQTLVNLLTGIVKQWNAWLNSRAGQEAMKTFFHDSKDLIVALFNALGPLLGALAKLVIDLMPAFTAVLRIITPLLTGLADGISLVADALKSKLFVEIVTAPLKFNPLILLVTHLHDVLGFLKDAIGTLGDAWHSVWDAMKAAFSTALDFMLGGISTLLGAVKAIIDTANLDLPVVGHIFGSTFGDASKAIGGAQTSIDNFRKTLEPTQSQVASTVGQIGGSYQTLAKLVPGYMSQVVSATTAGLSAVDKQLVSALDKLGIKPTRAIIEGLTTFPGQPGSFPTLTKTPGNASGGIVQIGRPGQKGRDTVGLNVGGTDIAVGAGEKVAVFNNEQQAVADHFMAPVGGLGGMFSRFKRPHYMAGGGVVPGFAGGGNVGSTVQAAADPYVYPIPGFSLGRTDEGVDASAAAGTPIGAIGDSRLVDVVPSWYKRQPLLDFQLLNGPDAGRFWYLAEQIVPTSETRGATFKAGQAVARFAGAGTGIEIGWAGNASGQTLAQTTTGYSEGQVTPAGVDFARFIAGLAHGKITGGGAFGGAAGAAAPQWVNLTAPKWKGPGGPAGAIGQGAVAKVLAAANQYGQTQAPGAGASGLVSGAGVQPGNWFQVANQIAKRHGWGPGEVQAWYGVEQLEDGSLSLTAKNPTSDAYGLAQFINGPSEYATYGGDATTIAGQLTGMANYIAGRYKTPTAALAYERAHHSYAAGGLVDLLQAFAGGGFADLVKTLPPGGGRSVDVMTSGSNDPAGNSGGFNQAGSPSIFGRIPAGPEPGPWWAEGDRGASIGMSFGGKRGGQAARFTYGNRSTVAVKVDTGNGNSYGDLYPPVDQAIGFDRVGKGGPVKVDFLSDAAAKALLGDKAKTAGPRLSAGKAQQFGVGLGSLTKHPFKLPKFKALPGFDPADTNQIASIENYLSNTLTPWQGLITGEHSRQAVVPLVTLADGSQVVNWDGMIDPVTGQFAKGINARLAEIGHLGGSPDLNTELGIDQRFLDSYLQEGLVAARAQKQFSPWLSKMQADRQRESDAAADDQATIDRVTSLKAALPKQKADRTFAITQRFATAKHKLQTSSAKGKFNAAQLLTEQLSGLTSEESAAKSGVGAKAPDGWKGTKKGWAAERKRELADLTTEFSQRRQALHAAASASGFTGTLARSKALFGLGQEEQAEKHQLSDTFTQRGLDFSDQLRSSRLWLARDKRLVSSDETALTAATGSKDGRTVVPGGGSFEDTLRGLLSPMGPLQINIDTMNKIDIPNLLDEVGALTGTKPPAAAAATTDLTALLSLVSQQLANTQQELAVSEGLTSTLTGFTPVLAGRLLGSLQTGIDRVPQTGPYLLHRDEMVIPDPSGPQSNRAATVQTAQGPVEIVIQMGNNDPPLMKIISAAINGQSLQVVQDHAGQRARLLSGVRRP